MWTFAEIRDRAAAHNGGATALDMLLLDEGADIAALSDDRILALSVDG